MCYNIIQLLYKTKKSFDEIHRNSFYIRELISIRFLHSNPQLLYVRKTDNDA